MADPSKLIDALLYYGGFSRPTGDAPTTRHPDIVNALAQTYAQNQPENAARNRLAGDPVWPRLPPLPDNRPSLRSYDPQAGRPHDAMAPVAEALSPMGAYGLAGLATTAAMDARQGKYDPETLAPLVAGIFAGPRAKTANLALLERAKEMAAKGAARDDIWRETGWRLDSPDGKPRFEIPDNEAVKRWRNNGKLSSVISHDELFAAYPELAGVKTKAIGDEVGPLTRAYYDPGRGWLRWDSQGPILQWPRSESIGYRKGDNALSSLLHEAQHAGPQRTEGFAKGTSAAQSSKEYYKIAPGEVEARNVQKRMNMTPEERRAIPPWATE